MAGKREATRKDCYKGMRGLQWDSAIFAIKDVLFIKVLIRFDLFQRVNAI